MASDERPDWWWRMWAKRRDVEDYRSWAGRASTRRVYAFLSRINDDGAEVDRLDILLPATEFEDRLLDVMDFRTAWPLLSPQRQQVLLLTAEGMSNIEIAAHLGKTQNAVACLKRFARQTLRAACAVVV